MWSAIPIFALGAAGLSVDALSPDALCPAQEETRRAVDARLGSVELDGTWRATYVLVHRTRGDFVSLSLFDPSGVVRLERQLPVQAGSCATLSGVIALVLERFFLRPQQLSPPEHEPEASTAPAPSEPPPAPVLAAGAMAAPVLDSAPPIAKDTRPAPTAAPPSRRFRAGAALWATTSWVAPSLSLDRAVAGTTFGVSASFDMSSHQNGIFQGSAAVRRVPVTLFAQWQARLLPQLAASATLELLSVFEAAQTQALAESGRGFRAVPGAGARLGAELFPTAAARPFAELTLAHLFGGLAPAFQVGGAEVLAPPSWVLGLASGIRLPF